MLGVLQFLQQERDGCEVFDGVMFSCDEKRKTCERRTSSPTASLFFSARLSAIPTFKFQDKTLEKSVSCL